MGQKTRHLLKSVTNLLDTTVVLWYYHEVMTPAAEYRRLNKILWMGRLPKATVKFIDDEALPRCYGITLFDLDFVLPVIFLNASNKKNWKKTLIHEMIHVSEPSLPHGKTFDALVNIYFRLSKNTKKGYRTL